MRMYSEGNLAELTNSISRQIIESISNENDNYILNVSTEKYIKYFVDQNSLDFPEILFDDKYVDSYEKQVLGENFPIEFHIWDPNKSYTKQVIVYHIPVKGDIKLLGMKPNTWTPNIGFPVICDLDTNEIKIEVINFYDENEKIIKEYENAVTRILSNYRFLKSDVQTFNNNLYGIIKKEIQDRKDKILKTNNLLSSLGVPIKSNIDKAKTFVIPEPNLKEKITIKPIVTEIGFSPEPTLDDVSYHKILKVIHDVGKNFERMPSTYLNKHEEDLRDHLLFVLDPQFENGSASGETFNKKGKTDIQLRHNSSVVFIAECKFWSGIKGFYEAIDQLLSYLTWRDSKTSLIIFVRNKEITPILQKIESDISNHANFLQTKEKSDESWMNYTFSLPIDINKEIRVAIQIFHLP